MPFTFQKTAIPAVVLVEYQAFPDTRGSFAEFFKASDFAAAGLPTDFVQENFSTSVGSVLRGLHYQKEPYAQGKLVMAVHGQIFDVAVDIRRGSPTFGKWVGEVLSQENRRMLWVPEGFAHGFCVLSPTADVLYRVTGGEYAASAERGIIWSDPEVAIHWPVHKPLATDRDLNHPCLKDADINFVYRT